MSIAKQVRIVVVRPSISAVPATTDQEFFPITNLNGNKASTMCESATDDKVCLSQRPVRVISATPSSSTNSASAATSIAVSVAHDTGSQDSISVSKSNQVQHTPTVEQLYSRVGFVRKVEWVSKLFMWFASEHRRTHRYAAYVFGRGGEGKTRVVRALTEGKNVFECRLTEAYAFDGFESNTDILLVEDVNWDCFDNRLRSTLLSIMARQPSVIQRKHRTQETVANDKVLTIFTSNFKLPADVAFRRRCYRIWAKTKACADAVDDANDDPGDDDAQYINPKLPGVAFGKRL